VFYIPHTHIHQ